jgi:serine/threonine protein kinase
LQQIQNTLPLGSILRERYVIEKMLGKGGYGSVYLVRDLRVKGNLFALKETHSPERKDQQRFLFEGELLKRLDHRALARVYRVFDDESHSRTFMLMDYIEGPNLEALRQRQLGNRFSLAQVLTILAPVVDAVHYLHNQQPPVLHRDIKPSNIIVPTSGDDAVLVDFGIAKEHIPDGTTTAFRTGSPGYAAPEQYSRGTSIRSDVYGLGATFYTLLTGALPADALHRMTQVGEGLPDPLQPASKMNPAVSLGVAQVIHKAMSLNANERYTSIEAFWEAFAIHEGWKPLQDPGASPAHPATHVVEPTSQPLGSQLAMDTPAPTVVTYRAQPRERRFRLSLLLPILFALLLLTAASISALLYLSKQSPASATDAHQAATITILHPVPSTTAPLRKQPTAAKPTHTPKPKPTTPVQIGAAPTSQPTQGPIPTPTTPPSPTPSPTPLPPSPTPTPAPYPNVAGSYSGTIDDTTANIVTGMSLLIQQQPNQGKIRGNFTVNPPLLGNGNFTGSVTTAKSIQFTVQSYKGDAPLYFWGQVLSDGSLSGNYCSVNAQNKCDPNAGASGTWDVAPTASPLDTFDALS